VPRRKIFFTFFILHPPDFFPPPAPRFRRAGKRKRKFFCFGFSLFIQSNKKEEMAGRN